MKKAEVFYIWFRQQSEQDRMASGLTIDKIKDLDGLDYHMVFYYSRYFPKGGKLTKKMFSQLSCFCLEGLIEWNRRYPTYVAKGMHGDWFSSFTLSEARRFFTFNARDILCWNTFFNHLFSWSKEAFINAEKQEPKLIKRWNEFYAGTNMVIGESL